MSADIVNLRRARKAKAKADKEQRAAENRVVFGRSKIERMAAAAEKARDLAAHEGLKRTPVPEASPKSSCDDDAAEPSDAHAAPPAPPPEG